MKKIALLFMALSLCAFSAPSRALKGQKRNTRNVQVKAALTPEEKFSQIESGYQKLVQMEEQEFEKLKANATLASSQLEEKTALKAQIEDKIAKAQDARKNGTFGREYDNILKEYRNVEKALDAEIRKLSRKVENFKALESLKSEN
mgnify:CR=1 FL=1